jgi:hypothetical protein
MSDNPSSAAGLISLEPDLMRRQASILQAVSMDIGDLAGLLGRRGIGLPEMPPGIGSLIGQIMINVAGGLCGLNERLTTLAHDLQRRATMAEMSQDEGLGVRPGLVYPLPGGLAQSLPQPGPWFPPGSKPPPGGLTPPGTKPPGWPPGRSGQPQPRPRGGDVVVREPGRSPWPVDDPGTIMIPGQKVPGGPLNGPGEHSPIPGPWDASGIALLVGVGVAVVVQKVRGRQRPPAPAPKTRSPRSDGSKGK